jgi:hypothetical protein
MPLGRSDSYEIALCGFEYRGKKPRPCRHCGVPCRLRLLIVRSPVCPACQDECMFSPSNRDCCLLMFIPDGLGSSVSHGKVCVDCAATLVGDEVLHWNDWTRATLAEHLARPRPA